MGTTVQNLIVAASLDDATERSDSVGFSAVSGTNDFHQSPVGSGRHNSGLRFTGVLCAPGDTIDSAILSLNIWHASFDSVWVNVYAEDADDPVDYGTDPSVNSRALLAGPAVFAQTNAPVGYFAMDVTAPIQAWCDARVARVAPTALNLLVYGRSDHSALGGAWSWNHAPTGSAAPKLDLTFTPPASGGTLPLLGVQ